MCFEQDTSFDAGEDAGFPDGIVGFADGPVVIACDAAAAPVGKNGSYLESGTYTSQFRCSIL